MQKYGGVNNQKSLNEIQEAHIVSAPGMSKVIKKQSGASIIFGWLVYLVVSYIFTDLLLMVITDANDKTKFPLWIIFILPATPFLFTLLFKIFATFKNNKHANPEG